LQISVHSLVRPFIGKGLDACAGKEKADDSDDTPDLETVLDKTMV